VKVAIFGSYGEHNLGDEAILDGLLQHFIVNQDIKCLVFSHHATKSAKIHRYKGVHFRPMIATGIRSFVKQLSNGNLKKSIRLLKQCEYIVIGGGGLFHEQEVGQVGIPPLLIWWLRTLLFRFIIRRPHILKGIGVSQLKNSFSKWCMRQIANHSQSIEVRDQLSVDHLRACGVAMDIVVKPDLSWLRENHSLHREISPTPSKERESIKIGFQLRSIVQMDDDDLVRIFAATIDLLHQSFECEIHFFPLSFQRPDDRELIHKVNQQLKKGVSTKVHVYNHPSKYQKIVSEMDMVFSMRFHGSLLALQAGVLVVPMSYASKTQALLGSLREFKNDYPGGDVMKITTEDVLQMVKAVLQNTKYLHSVCDQYVKAQSSV
jgi:polysaccharide pyruvyl transferase WcaK-like protein